MVDFAAKHGINHCFFRQLRQEVRQLRSELEKCSRVFTATNHTGSESEGDIFVGHTG